jgi:hypothetical protein
MSGLEARGPEDHDEYVLAACNQAALSLQALPPASARASREFYILSMKPTPLASRPSSPSAQKPRI